MLHQPDNITFKNLTLEGHLLQAPLAGYTTMAARHVAHTHGRPALLATEMVSARDLVHQPESQSVYLARHPDDGPTAAQLWGNNEDDLAEATRRVVDMGFDVVDLNCGCPVRHVAQAGAGHRLMKDPCKIGRLVRTMRAATKGPLTVKLRLGPAVDDFNADEVAHVAEAEGADALTVHGRYGGERYQAACRLDGIARVVQSVTIPVIGNGDVIDGPSARRMLDQTDCTGVMIGRAAMGAPWVFEMIRRQLAGQPWQAPTDREVLGIFMDEVDLLIGQLGEGDGMRRARKLGAHYSRHLAEGKAFRVGLNLCRRHDQLVELCVTNG
ncbi:MAG: tRNA dihydrouridine synthase [Planctomycetota bacterium]